MRYSFLLSGFAIVVLDTALVISREETLSILLPCLSCRKIIILLYLFDILVSQTSHNWTRRFTAMLLTILCICQILNVLVFWGLYSMLFSIFISIGKVLFGLILFKMLHALINEISASACNTYGDHGSKKEIMEKKVLKKKLQYIVCTIIGVYALYANISVGPQMYKEDMMFLTIDTYITSIVLAIVTLFHEYVMKVDVSLVQVRGEINAQVLPLINFTI